MGGFLNFLQTMGQPQSQPVQQPSPVEERESPFDQIIRGALANPQAQDAPLAMQAPDAYVSRRMNEMVYGNAEPNKKSRAMAFLTNMLAGAAVGPKYISPMTRARADAVKEYQLAQENQRATIAEQRNQQQAYMSMIMQERLSEKDKALATYQQQMADVAAQKNVLAKTENERRSARDRVLNMRDLAEMDNRQRFLRLKERMSEYEMGAMKGRPEEVLMEAAQRLGKGEIKDAEFQTIKDVYDEIAEDRRQLKATGAPSRAAGSFQPITDDGGSILGYFNPTSGRLVAPPIEGRRNALPAALMEKGALRQVMIEDLNKLDMLAKKNTNSIGRVFGNIAAAKRWTVGAGPEVNDMFRIADNLADQLLRARSGAAISEPEYNRLRSLVPDPRGPEDKFFSDLASFKDDLTRIQDKMSGQEKGGAPFAGGGKPAPAQQTTPAPRRFQGGKRI